MVGMLSLSGLLMEGGRLQLARQELEAATISSALSMLAGHDEYLNDRFGLLALEGELANEIQFLEFLGSNVNESGGNIARTLSIVSFGFEGLYSLANARVLQRQILEYYKYRGPANIAREFLYIDEILELFFNALPDSESTISGLDELAENAEELIESINEIYDFLVTIQILDRAITGIYGGAGLPHLWNEHEVNDPEVKVAVNNVVVPNFMESYNELRNAIQEKVDFMQEPEPPEPVQETDPAPLASLTSLNSFEYLLLTARDGGFLDGAGIVDEDEPIELSSDQALQSLSYFGISDEVSRSDFFDQLNIELMTRGLEEISPSTITRLNDVLSAIQSAIRWKEANNARQEWLQRMEQFDAAINQAVDNYLNACRKVYGFLGLYERRLVGLVGYIDNAIEAFEAFDGNSLFGDGEDDFSTIIYELTTFRSEITDAGENSGAGNPEAGRAHLANQINFFENFTSDMVGLNFLITRDTPLSSEGMTDNRYYMDSLRVLNLLGQFDELEVDEDTGFGFTIWQLMEFFKHLFIDLGIAVGETIHPIPKIFDPNFTVRLESETTRWLPSNNQPEYITDADMSEVISRIEEAQLLLPQYASVIDQVNPLHQVAEWYRGVQIEENLDKVTEALGFLVTHIHHFTNPIGWIVLLVRLQDVIQYARDFYRGMKFIINNFAEVYEHVRNSLVHGFLLNTYAVQMFPNRMTPVGEITDRRGSPGDGPNQAFAGAHVEYIIRGEPCEITNQTSAYWRIFILRMLDNIRTMIRCKEVKGLLAKANKFAIIVFPIWLFAETHIDMNLLIRRGQSIPILKGAMITSLTGLKYNVFTTVCKRNIPRFDRIYNLFVNQKINVKPLIPVITPKMYYVDYLWFFLTFVSKRDKVMRMGDLIQMEMRFGPDGNPDFLLGEAYTYVRVESHARFSSVLPIISLGNEQINRRGWGIRSTKYVGY